ncbi:MAG: hypothetical protein KA160_05185 [Lacibacter sp.]|jgi:hypothetical protein|nr:hypothetical protein [Lacibacter sp.]
MPKLLFSLLFVLFSGNLFSQVYLQAGAGVTTNVNAGADLQVGYSLKKKATIGIGYFALIDDAQPLLMNVQVGYKLSKSVRMYGGYVRKQVSSNYKRLNTNSWIGGIEYNGKRFKKGNFYYSANYIPRYFFVCAGMKFNYK